MPLEFASWWVDGLEELDDGSEEVASWWFDGLLGYWSLLRFDDVAASCCSRSEESLVVVVLLEEVALRLMRLDLNTFSRGP